MARGVTDADIRAWLPHIEEVAAARPRRYGVEYDDLVQEGMIAVWQALEAGEPDIEPLIRRRMNRWARDMARQSPAHPRGREPVDGGEADPR